MDLLPLPPDSCPKSFPESLIFVNLVPSKSVTQIFEALMTHNFLILLACIVMISACQPIEKKQIPTTPGITAATVESAIRAINSKTPKSNASLIEKGVKQVASPLARQ